MNKILGVLALLFCLCMAAGLISKLKHREPSVSAPTPPTPTPSAPTEPQEPDLKSVPVKSRSINLTNAAVKSVSAQGITFVCDQGLLKIPFVELPPEFSAYYQKFAKNEPTVQTPRAYVGKPSAQQRSQQSEPSPKTDEQNAEEAMARAKKKVWLSEQIKSCENVINVYSKQSSFSKGNKVSSEEYDLAKAKLERFKNEYAELDRK